MASPRLGVAYAWQKNKKINGSLFYAVEYYLEIRKQTGVGLYIVDIPDDDLIMLNHILREKYEPNIRIIQIKRTQLVTFNLDKILVLDIKTFDKIRMFTQAEFLVFANETSEIKHRNTSFYGSYDYQNYDKYCILKLGLKSHRETEQGDKCFISTPDLGKLNLSELSTEKQLLFKNLNTHNINLFNEIDEIIYVHVQRDKNNRIIPEAFYHNKKISIIEHHYERDSIQIRYEDCKYGKLDKYILDENDIMVQDMLK